MQSSKFGELSPGRNGEAPRAGACRSCNAEIWWVKTRRGKNMPVNPNDSPHWETCPQAKDWKGGGNGNAQTNGGAQKPGEPPPLVWVGTVELDDKDDPGWFIVRLEKKDGTLPAVGDKIKVMRRS